MRTVTIIDWLARSPDGDINPRGRGRGSGNIEGFEDVWEESELVTGGQRIGEVSEIIGLASIQQYQKLGSGCFFVDVAVQALPLPYSSGPFFDLRQFYCPDLVSPSVFDRILRFS